MISAGGAISGPQMGESGHLTQAVVEHLAVSVGGTVTGRQAF